MELYPNDTSVGFLRKTYLDFIKTCQLEDGGFLNYLDDKGKITSQNYYVNTDEASARAFLALCYLVQSDTTTLPLRQSANVIIEKSLKYIDRIKSPRALGKILKGLYFLHKTYGRSDLIDLMIDKADFLCNLFNTNKSDSWYWFEPGLSYSNSDICEGLFYAYRTTQREEYKATAMSGLGFLLDIMFTKDMVMPVSHRSQIARDQESKIDLYGQQPVEVASLIECAEIAYTITQDEKMRELVNCGFTWFLGNNLLRQIVYNPATGGGHDGIEVHGVNLNQGAESSLSYLISLLTVEKVYRQPKQEEAGIGVAG